MDPQIATQYDGPMPDDKPFFVAHYGVERTVFIWADGDRVEADGYCHFHNGQIKCNRTR